MSVNLPPLRRLADAVTDRVVMELRGLLQTVVAEPILFGRVVELTFTGADTPVPVRHGLQRTPVGYLTIKRSAHIVVRDAVAPAGEAGLWVQSSGAGNATLYVF
jgi:hypothetical protein